MDKLWLSNMSILKKIDNVIIKLELIKIDNVII